MIPQPPASDARLGSLFSAFTSALQPARFPLALLLALLIGALAPVVDLAGGQSFGSRGFAAEPLDDIERELLLQRGRNAAERFASAEVAELERAAREGLAEGAAIPRLSFAALEGAVRDALATRLSDVRTARGDSALDAEGRRMQREAEERLVERATDAIRTIREAAPKGVATVFLEGERAAARQVVNGIFRLDPEMFTGGVLGALFSVPKSAIAAAPVVFPLAALVVACAVALVGGGLCRMAAVHVGRGARLAVLEGSGFARARALNLVSLPILPTVVLGALALVVLLFAFLLRLPVLNVIAAVAFVVPILVAALGAVLFLTALLAFPLMPAAVAVEDCDAGDAITRACALVLTRPLLWLASLATSLVVLSIGWLIVTGILGIAGSAVDGMLVAVGGDAGRALGSGSDAAIALLSGPDRIVGAAAGFWKGLFAALGGAYLVSLACDLSTRCYLLMRARVDGESPATIAGYGIR